MFAENKLAVWDITIKQELISKENIIEWLKEHTKKWAFQLEKGIENDYLHWQGRFSLKVSQREYPIVVKGCHTTMTSEVNRKNEFYVLKEDTRMDGPWTDRDTYIPRQVRNLDLFDWQMSILNDADNWDTRHINIIIDKKGHIGKSTLCTYGGVHGLARKIPIMDNTKDIMRMVMDTKKVRLYLVDFPRAASQKKKNDLWAALEEIKNGYAYDERYGFKEMYFDCPNIWVFMNEKPKLSYLTNDRWRFWKIENNKLVLHE